MDAKCFVISLTAAIQKALKSFGLKDCRAHSALVVSSFYPECLQHSQDTIVDCEQYRNMIGS